MFVLEIGPTLSNSRGAIVPDALKLDFREFHRAIDLYSKVSKRDFADIINKRVVNIAYIAMRKTPAAPAKRIGNDLMRKVKGRGRKGKGRPPIVALMIASGSEKAGLKAKPKPGLYGVKMREEIEKVIKRRVRTRAYIKSGFLRAVRDVEPQIKGRAKRRPRNVKKFSKAPGKGKAARPVLKPFGEILNYAANATKIAGPALQAAINADSKDMVKYASKVLANRAKAMSA